MDFFFILRLRAAIEIFIFYVAIAKKMSLFFYVYATIYSMCQKWISIYLYNVSIAIMNWDLR